VDAVQRRDALRQRRLLGHRLKRSGWPDVKKSPKMSPNLFLIKIG
jgi:hypothetical protein